MEQQQPQAPSKSSKAGDELRANVDDLHEEVQEMSELINELLSFSKAGLQNEEIKLEPVVVADTIANVVRREGRTERVPGMR